ncbi:BRO-N domain-containing protein [Yersinia kristensenii]|uniref:Phage antirepressor n=1 Tax=Yersinia kristensenii TaxID=28152 RepID=A0A0T9L9K3_YERKR|nr:BRO family protein [Yersinia kristensenii]CNE70526.1 phage antirepressor [Yersinia kristensenii]
MNKQSSAAVFNFDTSTSIRTFVVNGTPWFVATDVCQALQLTNPSMSLKSLDTDERSKLSLGRQGFASIISESGLYTLILRCRDAVTPGTTPYRFRKWVTSEVLPAIRQTGKYDIKKPEVLADLVGTSTTMSVRDGRRGKSQTTNKAAQRIADECVPMIMKAVQNQYHYNNDNVGPEEVIPALVSDARDVQLYALLRELADNGHRVSGCYRELEAMRHFIIEFNKRMSAISSHATFINQQTKIS